MSHAYVPLIRLYDDITARTSAPSHRYGGLERHEVQLAQRALVDLAGDRHPLELGVVGDEVLDARGDPLGLQAADVADGDARREVRVLAHALEVAAADRRAVQVDGRGEQRRWRPCSAPPARAPGRPPRPASGSNVAPSAVPHGNEADAGPCQLVRAPRPARRCSATTARRAARPCAMNRARRASSDLLFERERAEHPVDVDRPHARHSATAPPTPRTNGIRRRPPRYSTGPTDPARSVVTLRGRRRRRRSSTRAATSQPSAGERSERTAWAPVRAGLPHTRRRDRQGARRTVRPQAEHPARPLGPPGARATSHTPGGATAREPAGPFGRRPNIKHGRFGPREARAGSHPAAERQRARRTGSAAGRPSSTAASAPVSLVPGRTRRRERQRARRTGRPQADHSAWAGRSPARRRRRGRCGRTPCHRGLDDARRWPDRGPEPGSLRGSDRAVEAVEHVRQVDEADAGAAVADGRPGRRRRLHLDRSAVAELGRVVDEVEHGPLQLPPPARRRRAVGDRRGSSRPVRRGTRSATRDEQPAELARPAAGSGSRRSVASSTSSSTSAVSSWRLGVEIGDEPAALSGRGCRTAQHGDVRAQAGQRGAQLVAGVLHVVGSAPDGCARPRRASR